MKSQILLTLLMPLILIACSQSSLDNKGSDDSTDSIVVTQFEKSKRAKLEIDPTEHINYLKSRPVLKPFDFTNQAKRVNDSTIKFPIDIKEAYSSVFPSFALFDFNKDGHNDLFFQYYGASGGGEKNIIDIYLYDPNKNMFVDTSFSLLNPGFFFNNNCITEYYYGLGGGGAYKYLIKNGKFELVEKIDIEIKSSNPFEASFSYSQKPFADTVIFSDNMVRLPDEYKFIQLIPDNNQ